MAEVRFERAVYRMRQVEHPGRWRLTPIDSTVLSAPVVVDMSREEGVQKQEGSAWAPSTIDNLEERIESVVADLDKKIDNARPVRKIVTIPISGWSSVSDSGQTVYRRVTGVTGNATDLPILGLPPGQIKQLTSSPSLVNDNGTIYIYSAQIPNISLTATITMMQTR